MARQFTFNGTVSVTMPYEVTITATSYEEALEGAIAYIEDRVPEGDFHSSDDQVEVEVDAYEETLIVPGA